MSTFVDFTPSTTSAFQFQATLDGNQYTVTVTWNIFGQRYYINIADLAGNLILSRGMSESGPVLQASLTWAGSVATATTTTPHNVPVGSIAMTTISQTGSGFDGTVSALSTGASTLTYPLLSNPNVVMPAIGNVGFGLNLVGGYDIGVLLFHFETQQFEF